MKALPPDDFDFVGIQSKRSKINASPHVLIARRR